MRKILLRSVCVLLCLALCLGSVSALAEASAFSFTASFSMDTEAYPEQDQELVQGIADLLNMCALEGTFDINVPENAKRKGASFDLNFDLLLDGDEETRTSFRLYGCPTRWGMQSSLLGDTSLMINHSGLLEFAMKTYAHLDLPLQYAAVLISSYARSSAFDWVRDRWEELTEGEGTRILAYDDVMDFLSFVAENAENKRPFYYLVAALTLDLGYDSYVFEAIATLPEWAEEWMDEEGILIECNGDSETWSSGETVLFSREGSSWEITLPPMLEDGAILTASREDADGETSYVFSMTDEDETDLVTIRASVTGMPESLPFTGEVSAAVDLTGDILPNEIHAAFRGTSDGEHYSFSQVDAENGREMLTVSGTWTSIESNKPRYSGAHVKGVNLLTLNDLSLKDLVNQVMGTVVQGMLPLLIKAPATTFNTFFSLMDQYGIMNVLTSGLD